MLNIAFLCMVALGASALLKVGRAEAQVASVRSCVSLPYNLRYGQYDSAAVSNLQAYLNAAGHMSYPSTGYFGPLTLQAVLLAVNIITKDFAFTERVTPPTVVADEGSL